MHEKESHALYKNPTEFPGDSISASTNKNLKLSRTTGSCLFHQGMFYCHTDCPANQLSKLGMSGGIGKCQLSLHSRGNHHSVSTRTCRDFF